MLHEERRFSLADAKDIGESLGICWDRFSPEQFWMGLKIEDARGMRYPAAEAPVEERMAAGSIALAHLNDIPDYYTQLAAMTCAPLRDFHTFRLLLL
jgi:hypothetical protein